MMIVKPKLVNKEENVKQLDEKQERMGESARGEKGQF